MNQILESPHFNDRNNKNYNLKEKEKEKENKNEKSKIILNKKYKLIFYISFTISILFTSILTSKIKKSYNAKEYSKEFLQNYKIISMYSNNIINNNINNKNENQNKNENKQKNITNYERINKNSKLNIELPPHIIGTLKINKIKLNYPILSETNSDLLKISLCRFAGPNPNNVGNLCIAGHNYVDNRFFSNLNKLNINDKFEIYDNLENKAEYIVYEKYEVDPSNLDCINQNTNGKKIVTLLTCNNVTSKRLVIKGKII